MALDMLYQADVTRVPPSRVLAEWRAEGRAVDEFTAELVDGVERTLPELDAAIGERSEGWAVSRMPAVDRAILRLGCYELLHDADVPASVAINEAVVAAKELSTEDSSGFVNGVLGGIARKQADGKASRS